jgi:hypothetical protein
MISNSVGDGLIPRRRYRSRVDRIPSAAKAAIAAARPCDARGHFLPVVGDAVRPSTFKGGGDIGLVDTVTLDGSEGFSRA